MRFGNIVSAGMFAAALALPLAGQAMAQDEKDMQFYPVNAYWTGPYAAGGSAFGGGMIDYMKMLNERDGGINGVKFFWEKCETQYKNDRIVECYERMKNRGAGMPLFHPMSTGGTYAIFERAWKDKIPVLTIGYGRTDASDGRVFPYLFPMMTNYWSQNTAKIKFIGMREGGMDKLKGVKIANIHHDSAYGKETIPILDEQAKLYGFEVKHYPVAHPGLDQKAIWLQVGRQFKPDWVILRGWGVMNPTALKEAQRIGFPREKMVGVWWSGAEEDTVPAGGAAEGYIAAGFHPSGTDFPVIQDIIKHVYDKDNGELPRERLGSIYYNRAIVWAIVSTEAIRDAMAMFGNRPVIGAEVQQALEQFQMTDERIKSLGAENLMPAFSVTCQDHEGGAAVKFQQWKDGKWVEITDWIETDDGLVRPMVEKSAAAYSKEKGTAMRDCASVS
ncbi:MAG: ABC transporter substrate-binding protein [Arenicellales bacterium]|jgi:branched-chain amino acid transport system substrate-binding protein|nr:ABC transporter substrate-binding protein [Arenicellales bacterium]